MHVIILNLNGIRTATRRRFFFDLDKMVKVDKACLEITNSDKSISGLLNINLEKSDG